MGDLTCLSRLRDPEAGMAAGHGGQVGNTDEPKAPTRVSLAHTPGLGSCPWVSGEARKQSPWDVLRAIGRKPVRRNGI